MIRCMVNQKEVQGLEWINPSNGSAPKGFSYLLFLQEQIKGIIIISFQLKPRRRFESFFLIEY
jgi:hypothetical protein